LQLQKTWSGSGQAAPKIGLARTDAGGRAYRGADAGHQSKDRAGWSRINGDAFRKGKGTKMLADFKYALRRLGKTPGFALTALLTPAVEIGVNAAVFSAAIALGSSRLPARQAAGGDPMEALREQ
jgi:hypothetical protein